MHLGEHFAWLRAKLAGQGASSEDFYEVSFKVVLNTDIELRKLYRRVPFAFSPALYQLTLDKHCSRIQTLSLRSEVNSLRSQVSSAMGASSSSLGSAMAVDQPTSGSGTRDGGKAPSRGRGRFLSFALFRERPMDKASEAICLICAVRGHRISDCKSAVFVDGSPVKTKFQDNGLVQLANTLSVCLSFNIHGSEKCRYHTD